MGGTHLGGGFVLGWEAGRAAATGEYAEPHTAATFGQAVEKKRGVDLSMPIISVDAEQQRDSRLQLSKSVDGFIFSPPLYQALIDSPQ
jgi:hypothetical protein